MHRHKLKVFPAVMALFTAMMLISCAGGKKQQSEKSSPVQPLPSVLRVGTLYSPSSYFSYRGDTLGYDFEMAKEYAASRHMKMKVTVGSGIDDLVEKLRKGEIDLIAYSVPRTSEYTSYMRHCGAKTISHQVLVQRKGENMVHDVMELKGKSVCVVKDTKFQTRMRNLDAEIGGGIIVQPLERDTLIESDLIEMVAKGAIDYAVADSHEAAAFRSYYPEVDVSVALGMDQVAQWAVSATSERLSADIDNWAGKVNEKHRKELYHKYFETLRFDFEPTSEEDAKTSGKSELKNGRISPYDNLLQKYSSLYGIDWRLAAAVAYVESRFNPGVRSWAGALGIMQVMPSTARALGFSPATLAEPENGIKAGCKVLALLDKKYSRDIKDRHERLKFVAAAYNAGQGHISDAIAIASTQGLDPKKWEGQVEEALKLKSQARFYNSPGVKCGYFSAKETVDYVRRVSELYSSYRRKFPAD